MDVSTCIETSSGRFVDLLDPNPEDIVLEDIVRSLSRIPRFLGHTSCVIPYNVAQHSVHVSRLVLETFPHTASGKSCTFPALSKICLQALFHDAHEAYMGDIPSPLKKLAGVSDIIKPIENKLDLAIFTALSIEPITDEARQCIKYCDNLAQAVEGHFMMPSKGLNWDLPRPLTRDLQNFKLPRNAPESEKMFLEWYHYIKR